MNLGSNLSDGDLVLGSMSSTSSALLRGGESTVVGTAASATTVQGSGVLVSGPTAFDSLATFNAHLESQRVNAIDKAADLLVGAQQTTGSVVVGSASASSVAHLAGGGGTEVGDATSATSIAGSSVSIDGDITHSGTLNVQTIDAVDPSASLVIGGTQATGGDVVVGTSSSDTLIQSHTTHCTNVTASNDITAEGDMKCTDLKSTGTTILQGTAYMQSDTRIDGSVFAPNIACGVYLLDGNQLAASRMYPIFRSIPDCNDVWNQPIRSGWVNSGQLSPGGTGWFSGAAYTNIDDFYVVMPNYSVVVYDGFGPGAVLRLDFRNVTNRPVQVAPTAANTCDQIYVYYDGIMIV